MSIPTEPAVHAIAKALWVDHGNNPDNWVYRPPEDLAHYFRVAQIAYDACAPVLKADAWDECEAASYEIRLNADKSSWEPVKENPYRA